VIRLTAVMALLAAASYLFAANAREGWILGLAAGMVCSELWRRRGMVL
jgi:hypothetical protein